MSGNPIADRAMMKHDGGTQEITSSEVPGRKVEIREGVDRRGLIHHQALTTLDEVPEEHVYLLYRGHNKEVVIEADLLGVQTVTNSDGKLPPVIHIYCPICSSQEDPRALSITSGNKQFEIEDIPLDKAGIVTMADGETPLLKKNGKPVIMDRVLTIKESFSCTYCGSKFRITDNIISDA